MAPSNLVNGEETEEEVFGLCVGLWLQPGLWEAWIVLELQQWPGQAAHLPNLLEAGVSQDTRQGPGVEGGNSQWEQTPNPTPCPVIYILVSL